MGDFRQLEVWRRAKDLTITVYRVTSEEPFCRDFGLKDQIRRAAVSIPSNIAEGDERFSNQESIRFLYIANASIAELITQTIIAHEIGYLDTKTADAIIEESERISKMIKSLIKYRRGR